MSERILAAVDGSGPSDAALSWAVERARNTDGTIRLLHVVDEPMVVLAPSFIAQLEDRAQAFLEQQRQRVRTLAPDVPVTTSLTTGSVLEALKIASKEADLLVIGTHRHGVVLGEILGTFSLRAAASVYCSLAIIPEQIPTGTGVVVGVNRSSASLAACDFAAAEAAAHDDELLIVSAGYVTNPLLIDLVPATIGSLNREAALAAASAHIQLMHPTMRVRTQAVYGAPADALAEASRNSRLLVIGRPRVSGLWRFSHRPVSHDVILSASVPVILVHPGAATDEQQLEADGNTPHE
ncbi:universal stress protein [Leifsonia sp. Root112D2]|uniref:universal stress protein n=1 Tax=Leifsonia sp. Root112D2 TaxID=1736426 RepID=UPI0007019EC6|nr:universal stress protein [Leifsonia sp. Root112D2]KQV05026.1 hypothetical protein ASC63_14500 [Leifsonia sp. Root112D2]